MAMKHLIVALALCVFLAVPAWAQLLDAQGEPNGRNPAMQVWLRADKGVTTDGTSVTSWQDQSSRGLVFNVADPNYTPDLVASDPALNNQPVIDFHMTDATGAGGYAQQGTAVSYPDDYTLGSSGDGRLTVFVVSTATTLDDTYGMVYDTKRSPLNRTQFMWDLRTSNSERHHMTVYT